MSDICPLEVTQREFDSLKQCESVIVREYETTDGSRFAKVVAWGDDGEMNEQVKQTSLHIVPVGLTYICQRVVAVTDLL